jgi:hypothetical protein
MEVSPPVKPPRGVKPVKETVSLIHTLNTDYKESKFCRAVF